MQWQILQGEMLLVLSKLRSTYYLAGDLGKIEFDRPLPGRRRENDWMTCE